MANSCQQILVATSLKAASDPVVRTAAGLARRLGAQLYLLHAFPMPAVYFTAPELMRVFYEQLLEAEQKRRAEWLDAQLERCGLRRSELASAVIEAGRPHHRIAERAESISADLLVIGASEGDAAPVLGSVAERVLRQATCPVWIARGEPRLPPRRILAPIDLSPLSKEALSRGLRLLGEVTGGQELAVSTLTVLTREEQDAERHLRRETSEPPVEARIESWISRLDPPAGVRLSASVETGEPRVEILRRLEEGFDLALVGTHGRSGFARLLLGSVAEALARRASSSLLAIPPV